MCAKTAIALPGSARHLFDQLPEQAEAGDADILVEGHEGYDPDVAAQALGAVEVVRNGPVTSIGVLARPEEPFIDGNVFQVDLVKIPSEAFDYACGYFMWSDLGNLVGRIAHAMGVAHKHDGLYFYFRDPESPDYRFRDILLTHNHDQALRFLGYDPARFNQGFDTLEDIFEFAASSCFFAPAIYLLENRNARARVRDRKRPAYTGFLQWCADRPQLPAFEFPADKAAWHARLVEFFPHFQRDFEAANTALDRQKAVAAKFNGAWVSQLTGLQGKALGAVMRRFKESFASVEAQRSFVLASSLEDLEARVRQAQAEAFDTPGEGAETGEVWPH